MTPDGDDGRVAMAAQWVYWGFAFDDAWCDEGSASTGPYRLIPQVGRLLRAMETLDARACGEDLYLLALHDLAVRYQAQATPVQMRRWVDAIRLWLFGVVQQNTYRAQRTSLGVDDYLRVRLHDCGGAPVQAMYEFVCGAEVPGAEMDSPPVRAVTEAMWLVAALDNDRVSRHKELIGQEDDHNLFDAFRREHGCGLEEAAEHAVALRDEVMCLFLRLRDAVMPRASAPLRAYLTALGQGIRSNIDWSLDVSRYSRVWAPQSPAAEARIEISGGVVGHPVQAMPGPPPYPAIAWWWSQLEELEAARQAVSARPEGRA